MIPQTRKEANKVEIVYCEYDHHRGELYWYLECSGGERAALHSGCLPCISPFFNYNLQKGSTSVVVYKLSQGYCCLFFAGVHIYFNYTAHCRRNLAVCQVLLLSIQGDLKQRKSGSYKACIPHFFSLSCPEGGKKNFVSALDTYFFISAILNVINIV